MSDDSPINSAVRARFINARMSELWAPSEPDVLTGRAGSMAQEAEVLIQVRMGAEGQVVDTRYRVYGCPFTIAAVVLACERLVGLTAEELTRFRGLDLADALTFPAEKRGVALTVEDAVHALVTESSPCVGPR
ncbi:MAG: iron-sulfur cluster assembly scaffold protein [Pseudomonadota bacterium]|nr:iron-sulfur cluster assembly scaffold protein [Pseudomonadota bacterium]